MCSAATSRREVANLRTVDWQSLGINFVLVYSPSTFRGAPHTSIGTLTYPDGGDAAREIALVKALAVSFPGVTVVRVKEAIDTVGALITNLVVAVRSASLLSHPVGDPGARRRALGQPSPPGLRIGRAQDAGGDPRRG